ncbi:amine oxidase [flavin-containing] A-like [Andrena cerasifolii]|uniref:amine oxidase [flavin-containing] A-like n=1 Tax=Andrena cerasifolii TaxID=2819439 RepID=UPI00403825B6
MSPNILRTLCEFVIVAVPPPMQNRIVVHSPSQYLLLNARNEYASDENVFFNMTYKTPPWGNSFSGDVMTTWDSSSNLNTAYNATHNDMGQFVLAGYLAEVNSTHTQEKGLFSTLNECFETTEASNCLKYRERSHYSSNVKIGSSPMSVMKPTANINSINYIGVPTGRIFFASSEYAVNWPGTIDGAIEAGEVTAYSILTRIRPQALTSYELSRMWPPRKREQPVPFAIRGIQYLGLILNIAVLLFFLDSTYTNT